MFKTERIIAYGIILVLSALLFFKACNHKCPPCPEVVGKKIDTTWEKTNDAITHTDLKPSAEFLPSGDLRKQTINWSRYHPTISKGEGIYAGADNFMNVLSGIGKPVFIKDSNGTYYIAIDTSGLTTIGSSYEDPSETEYYEAVEKLKTAFFTARYYEDSLSTKYGKFYVRSFITENELKKDSLWADLNVPTVHEKLTLREPPRLQGYIGFGTMISHDYRKMPNTYKFDAFGASLTLKNRKDNTIRLAAYRQVGYSPLQGGNKMLYNLELGSKISFRKN